MRKAVSVAVVLGIALLAISSATAQNDRSEGKARLTALIQARIEAQQPVRLSAETITLTGDTLRLAGRAMIRFNDTSIRAEEIVVNQVTKRIDLNGNVTAFLGSGVASPVPPIDFR